MTVIVYTDLITGDEVISDEYPLIPKTDAVFEVDCPVVEVQDEIPDADDEEGGDGMKLVVNGIVQKFRLNSMVGAFPTLKDYSVELRGYLRRITAKWKEQGRSEEDIKTMQNDMQNYFVNVIRPNFKDYEFFVGESMDPEGMFLLLNYRDDGVTPYFTIWRQGLKATSA